MKSLLDDFNHLYIDNYFTSFKLANGLLENNTYITGTFRKYEREFLRQ